MSMRGFETEDEAKRFGELVGAFVRELSRHIDLERLDGITLAYDYEQALADLDRGVEGLRTLTRSEDYGVGVAMTPAVLRDGIVKSHIIIHPHVIRPIEDEKSDDRAAALYTLAHECAHVEINKVFDVAFPGLTLQQRHDYMPEAFRWQIISACWDEYAASRISAPFDPSQTGKLEEVFLEALKSVREKANECIKAYRIHADHGRIYEEVTREYAALVRYASYLQGHLAGIGEDLSAAQGADAALDEHWFMPTYEQLSGAFDQLWDNYGKWDSLSDFDAIGDIAEALIADGGITVRHLEGETFHIDVPFTPETMPI